MLKNKKLSLVVINLFITLASVAQTGFIAGIVTNNKVDTMAYAKVFVDSTGYQNYTNRQGSYLLRNVKPGNYTVTAYSRDRQLSQKISEITVVAGDTTFLDIDLAFRPIQGKAIVITVQSNNKNSEAATQAEKINEDAATEVMDEKTLKAGPSSNVAGSATKITGVSVVGGKYVYIRGLSDRYSKTMLNNAEIPGLDPNKNSVQLDMFPNAFISSLKVVKTWTPDLPADWAGGLMDMRTKEYPDSFQVSIKVGGSFNTKSSFTNSFLTYNGSSTDVLGFDNGTRDLPKYMQGLIDNGNKEVLIPFTPGAANQEGYNNAIESFNKEMQPLKRMSGMNHNFGMTIGNQTKWGAKKDTLNIRRTLGYFVGASYKRQFSYFDDGKRGKYQLTSNINNASALVTNRELSWERGKDEVLVGVLANLKFVANNRNQLGMNFIHNHSGTKEASSTQGFTDEDVSITFRNQKIGYLERSMNAVQLYGEHLLINPDSAKARSISGLNKGPVLDWTASYTLAKQDEPDLRYVTDDFSTKDGDTTYRFSSIYNAPARYYRSMQEYNLDHKINLTIPIEFDSAKFIEIKTGLSNVVKMRDFNEIRFDLSTNGEYNGNMEDYLADENIGYKNGEYLVGIMDLSSAKNSYTGFQSVTAGYLKVKVPLGNKLDFVGGVRDEMTLIEVTSKDPTLPEGRLSRNDILPSLNFNFNIWKDSIVKDTIVFQGEEKIVSNKRNLKVRLGYNKTLARPNFRELAPYATEDYDLGYVLVGNASLDRTLIDNFDLRLEYYPRKLEIFSISTFYKRFTNPIELLVNIEAANDEFQWRQVPRANLIGAEFEFKKRLDFINPALETVRVGANATIVRSTIQIEEKELTNIKTTDTEHADTRPLFGQSPYIVNGFIEMAPDTARQSASFKKTKLSKWTRGMSFNMNYNVFGERLVLVITGGTPDVYEMPFHSLNFSVSKKFSDRLSATFKVNNILNAEVKQVYKFNNKAEIYNKFDDKEYVFSSYKRGVSFSGSVTYKFYKKDKSKNKNTNL